MKFRGLVIGIGLFALMGAGACNLDLSGLGDLLGTTLTGNGETEPGNGDMEPGDGELEPGDGELEPGDGETEPGEGEMEPGNGFAGDAEAGQVFFEANGCGLCHGEQAEGAFGPSLIGEEADEVFEKLSGAEDHTGGVFDVTFEDAEDLEAYLSSL